MIGLALVAVVGLAIYIWKSWRAASIAVRFVGRWYPALLEYEEFFELVDLSSDRAHSLNVMVRC